MWAARHLLVGVSAALKRGGFVRLDRCRRSRTLGLPPFRTLSLQALSGGASTRGPTEGHGEVHWVGVARRLAQPGPPTQTPTAPDPRAGTARPTESNASAWSPRDPGCTPSFDRPVSQMCATGIAYAASTAVTRFTTQAAGTDVTTLTAGEDACRPRRGLPSMQAGLDERFYRTVQYQPRRLAV